MIVMFCFKLGAHRALPDVVAMERVVTDQSLSNCLSSLTVRCPSQQIKLWLEQKELFMQSTSLIKAFGKPALTSAQAKKLVSKNLLLDDIKAIFQEVGEDEFHRALKERGINSRPLREKLAKALKRIVRSSSSSTRPP